MSVAQNITYIEDKIKKAAKRVDRASTDIHLVAVSKRQGYERIEEALAAGHRLFGENRVQEAQEHWAERRLAYPDLKLHLIGPLQTNKVKQAVALFDVIETVDREKLARTLAKEMATQDRHLPCFIQVNTGEEPQKAGVTPADLPGFYRLCVDELGLNIEGLMCIPPVDEPAGLHFCFLAKCAGELGLSGLSMGMSADFEKAITCGATHIRVGQGLFGSREV